MAGASAVGYDAFNVSRGVQRQQKAENMADNAYYYSAQGERVEVRSRVQFAGGRAFYNRAGSQWVDSRYDDKQNVIKVVFGSPEYYELLKKAPENNAVMSLGQNVIFVQDNQAYEIVMK